MGLFDKPKVFTIDGTDYEYAELDPDVDVGQLSRFEHRTEPNVIAQVPLAGGGTVEVHGYATFYSRDWVALVWSDDHRKHFDCWVPAAGVRRPEEGEWHGKSVMF